MSVERLGSYLTEAGGCFDAAITRYRWSARESASFWEPLGHFEVALRNTLSERLAARQMRLGRVGSWLDDHDAELGSRARADIAQARRRVRHKGRHPSDGQTISELSFGFWRFLVSKRFTRLWPDIASGFPHAPDRQLATIEEPLARLHTFRNRIAHHHRIRSEDLERRYNDLSLLAGYIDPALAAWIAVPACAHH